MRAVLSIALPLVLAGATAAAQMPLVEFAAPRDGAVVAEPRVTVNGRAEAPPRPAATFDVVLVIDTSGSTRTSASVAERKGPVMTPLDVVFGTGPSILQAEVAAARRFVDAGDRASTRIGVVSFSEGTPFRGQPGNAWVDQRLTSEYDTVRAALERIGNRAPHGGTDMAAGIRLAVRELRALEGAMSSPRPDARKIVLFMTDGVPTLPIVSPNLMDERNVAATLDAARVAAKARIAIHTFCLGPEALSAPIVCRDAARITGGRYHAVQRPVDIVELLPATKIADVDLVSVRNATTGQMAHRLDVQADGRFSADVPLAPGANRVVAQVHGAAVAAGMATMVVHYRPGVSIEVEKERTRDVDIKVETPGKVGTPGGGQSAPKP
jgi:Mg-chelatase subunit ChlD